VPWADASLVKSQLPEVGESNRFTFHAFWVAAGLFAKTRAYSQKTQLFVTGRLNGKKVLNRQLRRFAEPSCIATMALAISGIWNTNANQNNCLAIEET
jgi:hypothetical protein